MTVGLFLKALYPFFMLWISAGMLGAVLAMLYFKLFDKAYLDNMQSKMELFVTWVVLIALGYISGALAIGMWISWLWYQIRPMKKEKSDPPDSD